jgi:hypothetical protein
MGHGRTGRGVVADFHARCSTWSSHFARAAIAAPIAARQLASAALS